MNCKYLKFGFWCSKTWHYISNEYAVEYHCKNCKLKKKDDE